MSAPDTWSRFRKESETCTSRFHSKLKGSWESLANLLVRQGEAFERASQVTFDSASLDNLDNIFSSHVRSLFIEPIEKYRRERPQQRAMEAFDDWDKEMEGAIGAMPEFLTIASPEWTSLVGTTGMSLRSRFYLSWRRKPQRVAFQEGLSYGLHLRRAGRVRLEGQLIRVLAQSSLELAVPWQSMIQIWLPQLLSHRNGSNGFHKDVERFQNRRVAYEKQATQILNDLAAWFANNAERVANQAPLARGISKSKEKIEKLTRDYFRYREFYLRQARAVETGIDLTSRLAEAEQEMVKNARSALAEIQTEHEEVLKELDQVVSWLQNWKPGDKSDFPPATENIRSAASRLNAWTRSMKTAANDVYETIEVASRIGSRPRRRRSFKIQTPRLVFRESLERQSETAVREGLNHLERQHQSIIREMVRAREVVAFASETAEAGKIEDLQIEREGIENARSLLEFHRSQTQEVPPEVKRSLALALSAGFLRTHTLLEAGQFGVARQAAQYGFPGAAKKLASHTVEQLREGTKAGTRRGAELYREALIRIGWIPAPASRVPHVVARGYLSHTLGAEWEPDRLPMIYRRLFRLAPVEDPRFLIGREDEMRALAEARRLWEQNREAAVILVGERGSGKTSLLNCAVQSTMSGLEIIRTVFSRRLTQPSDMIGFLGELLGVDPKTVENKLNSERRIVILEELERVFLRRIGHYGALRALLNLIAKTSKHTLWLISTNRLAFRLLNASVRLDPHFSHRINAMAVERDQLREAILVRHSLSGLRLQFAPASAESAYARRFGKMVGVEADPETEFFDVLYRESGGVFRTAFALWQRYIDRVEAGVLYMRYPTTPHYEEIVASLSELDLFTLAAILQHGGLTPGEHSTIFQVNQATSHAWLDNLLARELIETDPEHPGFRVVPEAGEVVRRTLFSRNIA